MRFGSVSSGIEAASVAFSPLGWQAAWFSEIDDFPNAALAQHYPNVPNLGDMTNLPSWIAARLVEAPEVFCGGTPCQAFSVAGLRQSLEDARGNLSLVFCEIANAIDNVRARDDKPEAIILWENVPGVLSTGDNAFGCFLAGLAGESDPLEPAEPRPAAGKSSRHWKWKPDLGSHAPTWSNAGVVFGPRRTVAWRTLDAQYFGLAQRRRRVFVVASARDGFDPCEVLFEFEGVRRDSAPSRGTGKDVAACLDARTSGGGFPGTDGAIGGHVVPHTVGTLQANQGPAGHGFGDFLSNQAVNAGHLVAAFGGNDTRGPIDVATAVRAKGGTGHGDFESETFIVPFDTTQLTHSENRSNPQDGDPCHPLAARGHVPAIAFSTKDYGGDACTELSPTLRAMPHDGSHANGGGQMGVAYQSAEPLVLAIRGRGPDSNLEYRQDGTANALVTPNGGRGGIGVGAIAYTQDVADPISANEQRTYTHEGTKNFRTRNVTAVPGLRVRRPTVTECERLQGFRDGYTAITYNGKPAADGPRYKAIGNSWPTPVINWIARRIAAQLT